MHKDSVAADVLQAFLHALVMANLFDEYKSAHSESYSWMDKHYRNLVVKVLSGCPFSFIYGTRLQTGNNLTEGTMSTNLACLLPFSKTVLHNTVQ